MIRIVHGSNCELETQIMLSGDLEYIDSDIVKIIMDEIEELRPTLY